MLGHERGSLTPGGANGVVYCARSILQLELFALRRYRPVTHGIMGTVEMAFWGEPSTNLSLIAR